MSEANPMQQAACASMGTHQCALICLSYSTNFPCPAASKVWTTQAIDKERKRRPNGPLAAEKAENAK